jgi:tetratricopeptide (TPR) repeat protein
MDILPEIIESMNKEELRFFKLIAHRQQGNDERRDLFLLDEIRKNRENAERKTLKRFYTDGDKNAFYRLKNRLIDDINRSLVLQHSDEEELLAVYKLMQIVRIYNAKNKFALAFHFLKKAEQKALKNEFHEILDIIYGEFIRLSNEVLIIDPETYVNLRKENTRHLNRIRQLDDLLAIVSHRLKLTQNMGQRQHDLLEVLEETISRFSDDKELAASPRFRFKVYGLVSQSLLQKQDYLTLEEYLRKTFAEFSNEQLFNRGNHETKLQMLTYMVNSLFKNGKVQESLQFAEQLHQAMQEFNNLLYERYEVFYYNALVNNYSTFDIPRAIEILQNLLKNPNLQKVPFYELFVYLNLATSYFDLKQFQQAARQLGKAAICSSFKKADESVKFKMAVAELIIRFELGDFDFWLYRKDQITKTFTDILAQDRFRKESDLIELMVKAVNNPDSFRSRALKPEISQFIKAWAEVPEDGEIIRYTGWIKEKTKA